MIESDTRQADWRRANPKKYDAHLAVQRALKAGQLERLACEVCGIEAVDAHHDQYDEPLARPLAMPATSHSPSSLWGRHVSNQIDNLRYQETWPP